MQEKNYDLFSCLTSATRNTESKVDITSSGLTISDFQAYTLMLNEANPFLLLTYIYNMC